MVAEITLLPRKATVAIVPTSVRLAAVRVRSDCVVRFSAVRGGRGYGFSSTIFFAGRVKLRPRWIITLLKESISTMQAAHRIVIRTKNCCVHVR
jgi:hypothetical protein